MRPIDTVTLDEMNVHVDKPPGALIGVQFMDAGFLWSRRVMISHIDSDSPARGKLEVGYEVRAVNGVAARSAAAVADLTQAAGGMLRLSVKPARPLAACQTFSRCFGWSPRVVTAILLGVAALCGAKAWSSSSVRRAAALEERAKSQATHWRAIAKAETKKLEEGHAAQQAMARRSVELQQRIRLLRHANETASSRIGETISALRAQHHNLTEQRRVWRRAQHEHQQRLKDLRSESSSMETSLASERQRAKEAEKQLSEARAEATAALTRERALVLQMRQKIRQRMIDAAKELEDMMLAAQARDPTSEVTADRVDFAALIGQMSGVPAIHAGSAIPSVKEGAKRGGKRHGAKGGGGGSKRKEARWLSPPQSSPPPPSTSSAEHHAEHTTDLAEPLLSIVGEEALVAFLHELDMAFGNIRLARPRYFSLVTTHESLTFLFARAGRYAEEYRTILAALSRNQHGPRSLDPTEPAEYRIAAGPKGTLAGRINGVIRSHAVSHNAAFATEDALIWSPKPRHGRKPVQVRSYGTVLWAVGGQHLTRPWTQNATLERSANWHSSHRKGIYLLKAIGLQSVASGAWFGHQNTEPIARQPIIDGRHPGCVERRDGLDGVCEFDGVSQARPFDWQFHASPGLCQAHADLCLFFLLACSHIPFRSVRCLALSRYERVLRS